MTTDDLPALPEPIRKHDGQPLFGSGQMRDYARAAVALGDEQIARLQAEAPKPIDMILHCPACGMQHIDGPWQHGQPLTNEQITGGDPVWSNPPHRSHLCHCCGHIWRPADVPTNGVTAITTKGKNDSPQPAREPLDQIIFALERQARVLEHRADELMAQHDYGAEGPGQDARMLRAAIAVLQGHPWLTELRDYPLPPWKSVSMLRSLPLGTLAVQFARQPTTTEIDHLVTLLRRAGSLSPSEQASQPDRLGESRHGRPAEPTPPDVQDASASNHDVPPVRQALDDTNNVRAHGLSPAEFPAVSRAPDDLCARSSASGNSSSSPEP